MAEEPIKIIIVEDHNQVRRSLRYLFESDPQFDVVAEAADGKDAVKKVVEHKPDVVLMDVQIPGLDGLNATWLIKNLYPRVKVLLLTMYRSNNEEDLLSSGADGYFIKGGSFENLLDEVSELSA